MSATSPGRAAAAPEVLADTRRRRADWARQVADILRGQVLQGAFPDGLLPDEASLAQAFGAPRNAVRDAFGILRAEGQAYMHVDECWYCGPCAARCPTGAVTVNMPYLLR